MSKMNNAGPGNGPFAEADDDIVDLLEVVKPGKPVASAPDPDEDFSKDLESMLDTLSRAQAEKDNEAEPSAPAEVQPFPDPTPVDHKVDYNEQLDLPGMDDLDSILHTLGPAARNAAAKAGSPADEPDALLPEAASLPDLDALPPPARQAGAGRKPPAAQDDDLLSGYLDDLKPGFSPAGGEAADAETQRGAGIPALADMGLESLDDAGHAPRATAPADSLSAAAGGFVPKAPADTLKRPAPAVQPATVDPARTGTRLAGVDMHELDTLLDDMLGSAPASGAAGQASVIPTIQVPKAAPAPAPATPVPAPAPAAQAGERQVTALADELAALRQEMLELRGDFEHRLSRLPQPAPDTGAASEAVLRQLETQSAGLAAQSAKLEDLELTQASREQEHERRIKELEGLLADQSAQLSRLGSELEARNAALADTAEDKDGASAKLAELEQTLTAHASQLSACESQAEQAAVAQAARLAALEEKLAEQATQLAHSEERVLKQLSSAQEGRLAAVEEAADGHTTRLALLEEAQAQSDARAVEQGTILKNCAAKAEDLDTTLADQAGRALEDALRLAEQGDKLTALAAEVESQSGRFTALDNRFAALEDSFAALDKSMAGVERRFGELHAKLDRLAAEAAARVIREELAALLEPEE